MRDTMHLGSTRTDRDPLETGVTQPTLWESISDSPTPASWPADSWEHDDLEAFLRNHAPDHAAITETRDTDWDTLQLEDILGFEDAHVHHLEALGLDNSS